MATEVKADCGNVAIENVPDVLPAGIVNVAGTVATEVLAEVSVTTASPAGAGPLRVTVAVEGLPP